MANDKLDNPILETNDSSFINCDYRKLIKTQIVTGPFNIKERLSDLYRWEKEYVLLDERLKEREINLNLKLEEDLQIGAAIARKRRRIRLLLSQYPLELEFGLIDNKQFLEIRKNNFQQFTRLTKREKLLWLNNFEFILTPSMRKLYSKLHRIRSYRSLGQQRCLLLGGPAGMGKTTCLNALVSNSEPEIRETQTIVPFVLFDAPATNKSSRALYRRLINSLGLAYLPNTSEDLLAEHAVVFLDSCQVEMIFIDEIEQIVSHEIKRKILDLSNQTRGIPIICASCNPERWADGDPEIKGRWKDSCYLDPFNESNLGDFLTFLEILIPFSQPSNLNEYVIVDLDNRSEPGPASFIYEKTKGILLDIMLLVRDASRKAILRDMPCITMDLLHETWDEILTGGENLKTCSEYWVDR